MIKTCLSSNFWSVQGKCYILWVRQMTSTLLQIRKLSWCFSVKNLKKLDAELGTKKWILNIHTTFHTLISVFKGPIIYQTGNCLTTNLRILKSVTCYLNTQIMEQHFHLWESNEFGWFSLPGADPHFIPCAVLECLLTTRNVVSEGSVGCSGMGKWESPTLQSLQMVGYMPICAAMNTFQWRGM